ITDEVSGGFEQVGEDFELGGEDSVMVRRLFQLPRIPPREQRGPRGGTLGRRREAVVEQHAPARDAIERRRAHEATAIGAHARPACPLHPAGSAEPLAYFDRWC